MLKFDDIPDISDVANFLSKNNLDTASTEDVWAVARQFEDVPNFDNIFLELTYEQIPQAIENYFLNCAFFSQQYRRSTGRTCNLSTFARFHFDTVDSRTNGDVANRQGVTYFDGSFSTGNQYSTGLNTARSDDVATLTVCIAQQCNEGSTILKFLDT